jgi:putative tricarboxylic transport membrane protein
VSAAPLSNLESDRIDAWLAFVFGVLGYLMRTRGYPVVPLILGLILGPIAEANFARALQIGQGSVWYFFDSATAQVMWALLILTVLARARQALRARTGKEAAAEQR